MNLFVFKQFSNEEKKELVRREKISKYKRCCVIAVGTIAGGALFAASGGLAAPLIAEGVSSVVGTSAVGATAINFLGGASGKLFISSIFGSFGASSTGYRVFKRVSGIEEFHFCTLGLSREEEEQREIPLVRARSLTSVIAISGWISESDDFFEQWNKLNLEKEQYYLCYETKHLLSLGKVNARDDKTALNSLIRQNVSLTNTVPLTASRIAIPAVAAIGLTSMIDMPWSVCCSKAVLAGKQLAEVLLSRNYGQRPVSLIGFSIGARVIYYCLLEMCTMKNSQGIIENVYLIGAPCPADKESWKKIMNIVCGVVTNAYSMCDNVLKFMYRCLSFPKDGIAGLEKINIGHKRLKNVDVSSIVSDHFHYSGKLVEILEELKVPVHKSDK